MKTFEVIYKDDDNQKHLIILNNKNDIKFIKDRFTCLSVKKIDNNFVINNPYDNYLYAI